MQLHMQQVQERHLRHRSISNRYLQRDYRRVPLHCMFFRQVRRESVSIRFVQWHVRRVPVQCMQQHELRHGVSSHRNLQRHDQRVQVRTYSQRQLPTQPVQEREQPRCLHGLLTYTVQRRPVQSWLVQWHVRRVPVQCMQQHELRHGVSSHRNLQRHDQRVQVRTYSQRQLPTQPVQEREQPRCLHDLLTYTVQRRPVQSWLVQRYQQRVQVQCMLLRHVRKRLFQKRLLQ